MTRVQNSDGRHREERGGGRVGRRGVGSSDTSCGGRIPSVATEPKRAKVQPDRDGIPGSESPTDGPGPTGSVGGTESGEPITRRAEETSERRGPCSGRYRDSLGLRLDTLSVVDGRL